MQSAHIEKDIKPWYKQFWPWFIMVFPFSAVVAGISTVFIAINTKDSLVADDYYKGGLAINKQLDKQRHAIELGLDATAVYSASEAKLTINISSKAPVDEQQVILYARHTTLADNDRQVTLTHIGNQHYQADMPVLPSGNWYMVLEPADASWRMDANINHSESSWVFKAKLQ